MGQISESYLALQTELNKGQPNNLTVQSLLTKISQAEFVTLYEDLLTQKETTKMSYFSELSKNKTHHALLIYLITNSPVLNDSLMSSILGALNDEALLELVAELLTKSKKSTVYTTSLNQVLLVFCDRLYLNQKPDSLLYQWDKNSHASDLAQALFKNPQCLMHLAQLNSTLYAWTTWSSYDVALKHRIDALLNLVTFTPKEVKFCALMWLAYIQDHLDQALVLFQNLKLSEHNRKDKPGSENLLLFKKTLWSLIHPDTLYQEELFESLFRIPKQEFAALVQNRINGESEFFTPYLHVLDLSKNTDSLNKLSPEQLALILSYSLHSSTLINWPIIEALVNNQSIAYQSSFCTSLIKQSQHPLFVKQAYELCARLLTLENLKETMSEDELSWLLVQAPEQQRNEWLELVSQQQQKKRINIGLFFAKLPDDSTLIDSILNHELFSSAQIIAELFTQLHQQEDCSTHLMCLHQYIKHKDKEWRHTFLMKLCSSLTDVRYHLITLFLTNSVILTQLDSFDIEVYGDKALIINYLNLISRLSACSMNPELQSEIQQITFQIIDAFIQKDALWATYLVNEPIIDTLVLRYARIPFDEASFHSTSHPLTTLLLNPAAHKLNPNAIKDEAVQKLLKCLLISAESLNIEQFHRLFHFLEIKNQQALIRAIVLEKPRKELHQQVLALNIAVLDLRSLYDLCVHSTDNLYPLLLTHPRAYEELSLLEWHTVFDRVKAHDFISMLNTSSIPVVIRYNAVNAFYREKDHKPQAIAQQLKIWNCTSEQLLALANYTIDEQACNLFEQSLVRAEYTLDLNDKILTQYILNKTSYLDKKIQHIFKNNVLSLDPKIFQNLSLEELGAYLEQGSIQLQDYQTTCTHLSACLNTSNLKQWIEHCQRLNSDELEFCTKNAEKLSLKSLQQLLHWVKNTKKIGLTSEPMIDLKGLKQELVSLNQCVTEIKQRLGLLAYRNYGYLESADNSVRFSILMDQLALKTHPIILAQCINSYADSFAIPEASGKQFFTSIDAYVRNSPNASKLLDNLSEQSIAVLLTQALKHPENNNSLLEQLIQSIHTSFCQQQLEKKLGELLSQIASTNIQTLSQLTGKQIEDAEDELLKTVLNIQLLSYFAKPISALEPFFQLPSSPPMYSKKIFCAYASLYNLLLTHPCASQESVQRCYAWLYQSGQKSFHHYSEPMDKWILSNELKEPRIKAHWLKWKSALYTHVYKDNRILPMGIVLWLNEQNKGELKDNSALKDLMHYAISQNKLLDVLTYATQSHKQLTQDQAGWLCEQSLPFVSQNPEILEHINALNSWQGVLALLATKPSCHFLLLKQALSKQSNWDSNSGSPETQNSLLSILETAHYQAAQVLELINSCTNDTIKSLLIVYLLSDTHYLNALQGSSFLESLGDKTNHQVSRLNGLLLQLQPNLLTTERLAKLPPETALSILCCITQFHRLTQEQVRSLLTKLPAQAVIGYWLNHYANTPNAYYLLAELIHCSESAFFMEFNKLADSKCDWIRRCALDHLELFTAYSKLFPTPPKEEHLIYAVRKYLGGHPHKAYIQCIKQFTEHLLSINHVFSLEATQALIMLHGDPQFAELNNNTAYLVNHYIKTHAQNGSVELFYDQNQINIQSLLQPVQLKPISPGSESENSLFSSFLTPLLNVDSNSPPPVNQPHPLIEALSSAKITHAKAFDYFLIYYKNTGNIEVIKKTLNAYLDYYARQNPCTETHRKSLYNLSTFITRQEMDTSLRDMIFNVFLEYPNLYDPHISYCLFLFNAEKTVKNFGHKGTIQGYNEVIKLCTNALNKLDSKRHQKLIDLASTALREAETELSFAKNNGFFSRLFRRLVRCWIYGWTGFFSPIAPVYVTPLQSTSQPKQNPIVLEQISESIAKESIAIDFLTLLKESESTLTIEKLDLLILEFNRWTIKKPKDEQLLQVRYALHRIFHQLLNTHSSNTTFNQWVQDHQSEFIMNRFALLEALLYQNKHDEALKLLSEINQDSSHFHYLTQELTLMMPQTYIEAIREDAVPSLLQQSPGIIIGKAASLVNTAWSWTTSSLGLFVGTGTAQQQTTEQFSAQLKL